MMMNKALPYDAEVEYLESAGNCIISTDFIPTGDDIRIQTKVLYKGYTDGSSYIPWFYTYVNEQTNAYRIIRNNTSTTMVLLYNGSKANGGGVGYNIALNNIYNIDFNRNKYTINTSSGIFSKVKGTENSRYLYLFSPKFKGAFFFFRFWKDDVLMLDLIPVRKGNIGYMYDNVSRKLFGNEGSGQFILGPDKMGGVIKWLIINTLRGLSNPSLEERRVA